MALVSRRPSSVSAPVAVALEIRSRRSGETLGELTPNRPLIGVSLDDVEAMASSWSYGLGLTARAIEGAERLARAALMAAVSRAEGKAHRHRLQKAAYWYGEGLTRAASARSYAELAELLAPHAPNRDASRALSRGTD